MERSELDFALTEEQEMLRQTVRDFAEQRVRPAHEHVDHAAVHPTDLVDGLKELGLFGVLAPVDQGGAGMGFLAHVLCVEALSEAGGVMGGIVAAHGAVVDALALANPVQPSSVTGFRAPLCTKIVVAEAESDQASPATNASTCKRFLMLESPKQKKKCGSVRCHRASSL